MYEDAKKAKKVLDDQLRKRGQASFDLLFKAAAGDEEFARKDPLAIVTVTATDPESAEMKATLTREMSAGSNKWPVEIKVLSVSGVFQRIIDKYWNDKPPPKPFKVTITVKPHPDWEQFYVAKTYNLELHPGVHDPVHVWMTPKPSESVGLDKPRFRVPPQP